MEEKPSFAANYNSFDFENVILSAFSQNLKDPRITEA